MSTVNLKPFDSFPSSVALEESELVHSADHEHWKTVSSS